MAMACATSEPHSKAMPAALSWSMCLLLSVITVATLSLPTLVQADQIYASSPSPTLVLYFPTQASITVLNPAQNGTNPLAFSAVFSNIPHESPAPDSLVVGEILGQLVISDTGLEYTTFTNVLKTPKYAGTIEVQGSLDKAGNGELAITGGTGDFRKANGYVKFESNVDNVHFRSSFFISYDC